MFDKCFGSEEISHKILLFRGRISITASVELLIQQINYTDVVVYIQVVEKWLSNLKLRNKVRLWCKKDYNLKIIELVVIQQINNTDVVVYIQVVEKWTWNRQKTNSNECWMLFLPDKKLSTAVHWCFLTRIYLV